MKPDLLIVSMLLFSFFSVGQTETKQIEKFPNQETAFDQLAEFPGGQAGLNQFIATNFIYPKTAIENNISGKVYVVFEILASGEVSNIKIAKGIPDCYECSEEAIRVFKSMPKWSPAMKGGKPVGCFYKLPITISNN
jgi:protein TonB